MSGRAQAQQLADQLADTLGLPSLVFDEDSTLVLQFQSDLVVFVVVNAAETHLTFLTSFAGSAGPRSAQFLANLLQANFMLTDTEGATLGVDGENGPVTLQKRHRISELTYPSFEAELNSFLDTAFAWSREVELRIVMDKAGGGTVTPDDAGKTVDIGFPPDEANGWLRA